MKTIAIAEAQEKLKSLLKEGDILLIIPPFGSIDDIQLGPLNLHAIAQSMGYRVHLLYLNILLAAMIDLETYQKIYKAPLYRMIGERLFARAAYQLPPLGHNAPHCAQEGLSMAYNTDHPQMFYGHYETFHLEKYLALEALCFDFIQELSPIIAAMHYKIIGCTTTAIGQTNASMALFKSIKKYAPQTLTVIGGSNCDGRMADGIASLSADIDYVFSGESEHTFAQFLNAYQDNTLPQQRIIAGTPIADLDQLPLPDYQVKFEQYRFFLQQDPMERVRIWYETSRGCWWAEKAKRCTFCSIHIDSYRFKSPAKVLTDLQTCFTLYPDKMIFMTDNIIPPDYPQTLLPLLSEVEHYPAIGYQLRPRLDLIDLWQLKKARIHAILPGIEALSTHILQLMQKGTLARQNLLILRNGRCVNMFLDWNIIWGLPGDSVQDYQEILALLPLIRHLQPPNNFTPLLLMRFSPFLLQHQQYHISHPRPWSVFSDIYPAHAKIENLATYYSGEYSSGALDNPHIITAIANQVETWHQVWEKTRLDMTSFLGNYIILDNRDIHPKEKSFVLDFTRAQEIMNPAEYHASETHQWALAEKLGVLLDGWYIPLVTASPEILFQLSGTPHSSATDQEG